jgi:hypothetical protein
VGGGGVGLERDDTEEITSRECVGSLPGTWSLDEGRSGVNARDVTDATVGAGAARRAHGSAVTGPGMDLVPGSADRFAHALLARLGRR